MMSTRKWHSIKDRPGIDPKRRAIDPISVPIDHLLVDRYRVDHVSIWVDSGSIPDRTLIVCRPQAVLLIRAGFTKTGRHIDTNDPFS